MKRMKYILTLLILCIYTAGYGKDHNRRDADTTFQINFFDTTFTVDLRLQLIYDDTARMQYTLIMPVDAALTDTAKKTNGDSIGMQFTYPLDLQALDKQLNASILHRYNVPKTITQMTTFQIFLWMYAQVSTDKVLAGSMILGSYAQVYDEQPNVDFEERVHTVDSIAERIKYTYTLIEDRQKDIAKLKASLAKAVDSIEKNNESIKAIAATQAEISNTRKKIVDNISKMTSEDVNKNAEKIDKIISNEDRDIIQPFKDSINKITVFETILNDEAASLSDKKKADAAVTKIQNSAKTIINDNILPGDHALFQKISSGNGDSIKSLLTKDTLAKIKSALASAASEIQDKGLNHISKVYEKKKQEIIKESIDKAIPDAAISVADTARMAKDISKAEHDLEDIKKTLTSQKIYKIAHVDFQFERGFLENVHVVLKKDNRDEIYENSIAIGFTSKYNYRLIRDIKLYARLGNRERFIYLVDVMKNYDNQIDLYTRDYSPADTLVKVDPSKFPQIDLYKSNTVRLFETKYFTDLDGLSDKQPNGLVQFELSKRINLFTARKQVKSDINIGAGNYINLIGALNKIESRDKYLTLRNNGVAANGVLQSPSYATNLDFLQYRNMSMAIEANLFLLDFPTWKSTFTFDVGAMYGHTPVRDSSRRVDAANVVTTLADTSKLNANMTTFYPRIMVEVFSEKRIGFSLAYQLQYTVLHSNNLYKQVTSYAKSNTSMLPIEPNAKWSHMMELFLRFEINPKSASNLFFRSRIYWQMGDANTFFPQVQFGYSYDVNFQKLAK